MRSFGHGSCVAVLTVVCDEDDRGGDILLELKTLG